MARGGLQLGLGGVLRPVSMDFYRGFMILNIINFADTTKRERKIKFYGM